MSLIARGWQMQQRLRLVERVDS